jgi:drug/metabolite transporter (DMT)-like permease
MESQPISSTTSAEPTSKRQNLPLAIIAGMVAAIIGGIAWAIVTLTTEYQIGFMAIGVGFLVGFAVRLGNGATKVFSYTGAVLALLGCVLGNFFTLVGFYAKTQNVDVLSALSSIDLSKVPEAMANVFQPMDLVFYGIAVYEGYRFSQRKPNPTTAPASP